MPLHQSWESILALPLVTYIASVLCFTINAYLCFTLEGSIPFPLVAVSTCMTCIASEESILVDVSMLKCQEFFFRFPNFTDLALPLLRIAITFVACFMSWYHLICGKRDIAF